MEVLTYKFLTSQWRMGSNLLSAILIVRLTHCVCIFQISFLYNPFLWPHVNKCVITLTFLYKYIKNISGLHATKLLENNRVCGPWFMPLLNGLFSTLINNPLEYYIVWQVAQPQSSCCSGHKSIMSPWQMVPSLIVYNPPPGTYVLMG